MCELTILIAKVLLSMNLQDTTADQCLHPVWSDPENRLLCSINILKFPQIFSDLNLLKSHNKTTVQIKVFQVLHGIKILNENRNTATASHSPSACIVQCFVQSYVT